MNQPSIGIVVLFIALSAGACNNSQHSDNARTGETTDSAYTLTGKIGGLDTGWVYLMNRETDSVNPRPDSTRIKEGTFTFKGFAAKPQFVLLGIRGIQGDDRIGYPLGFFLDRGALSITGSKDTLYKGIVTGSAAENEYLAFPKVIDSFNPIEKQLDSIHGLAEKSRDQQRIDSVQDAFDRVEQAVKEVVKEYATSHPASYVAAFEAFQYFSYNPEPGPLDSIYKSFDPAVQNSYFGKKLKSNLETAKLLALGQHAPDFTQNDAEDHPVSLASFKGKYVLVDFWASWCGPCRRESPSLVKAYHQYQPKGFEVLGVSLDDDKTSWLEAVKKDQLSWTQVSDLKGWQNSVGARYGITSIPMNFLLDREGHILGKGLRGGALEKRLAQLLP